MAHDAERLVREGVELFNRGEFFECHEALEEAWTPTVQPERWFLQALIHFAVGLYHHQRNNPLGAVRQLRKGLRKIQPYLPEYGGIRTGPVEREIRRCLAAIESGERIREFPKIEQFAPYAGRD